ncbi:ABC transporter substrate-binding protein [Sphaerotilus mobilis]|uniref:ABC-type Fe3+-hydroxamate transport system substrate-binding protein n=1 Tax=Sphaerotilus mobilis TaxID=47994 RepID=A0A4Q7LHU4_9BURK|nr:ABC transporter substrate-binding protein [Sphaerotilus mobilis]RZS53307.1 ABC-type Fe3+-hydroxamate transport system substrate-binding protein [Sphaerotilus mobilis]
MTTFSVPRPARGRAILAVARKAAFAACLILSASLPTWSHAAPIEVTDAIGRKVQLAGPAQRVALNFNFEEFTAVAGKDGWSRVVGISRTPWEGWRPAIFRRYVDVIPNLRAMPDIGHSDDGTFSAEKIISLKPDVVLMAEWTWSSQKTVRDQLGAAGIPIVVIDYNAQMLDRHLASTRAIGKVMGTESRAEELAQLYEGSYRQILDRLPSVATQPRKKVYVELAQAGADTVGNSYAGTMWGRIVTTLGAENIADGKLPGPWGPLAAEAVLAANPDMIVLAGSSWVNRPKAVPTGHDAAPEATRRAMQPYVQRPGWDGIKAVRTGEVHAIEHGLCRSLTDFVPMQYLAKRLYPAVFRDLDPEAAMKSFHARYLPVPYSGTWMLPIQP